MGIRDRIEPFTPGTYDNEGLRRTSSGRLRRWSVALVPMIGASIILATTQSSSNADVENLWASAAFVLFVGGATAWVWRKVRDDDFEALRWRRLHRRAFWRAAVLALLAGLVCLGLVAFWEWLADKALGTSDLPVWAADEGHAAFFRGLATWLPAATVPLVLIEPVVWRLWPRTVQAAVRRARVAEMLAPDRRYSTRRDFDHSIAATGRPRASESRPRREPSGQPHRIVPRSKQPTRPPGAAVDAWWRNAAIAWDGSALTLTDGQGRTHAFAVARPGNVERHARYRRQPVAELVWFAEDVTPSDSEPARRMGRVLLLDADGWRVAEISTTGFTRHDVVDVARAAGLPFAAYTFGPLGRENRAVNRLVFPGRWRTVKIIGPRG